jgi:hypothetical protein
VKCAVVSSAGGLRDRPFGNDILRWTSGRNNLCNIRVMVGIARLLSTKHPRLSGLVRTHGNNVSLGKREVALNVHHYLIYP